MQANLFDDLAGDAAETFAPPENRCEYHSNGHGRCMDTASSEVWYYDYPELLTRVCRRHEHVVTRHITQKGFRAWTHLLPKAR